MFAGSVVLSRIPSNTVDVLLHILTDQIRFQVNTLTDLHKSEISYFKCVRDDCDFKGV